MANRNRMQAFAAIAFFVLFPSSGYAQEETSEEIKKLAEEAARDHDNVMEDPKPYVIFDAFGENALNITLFAFLPSMDNRMRTRSELHTSVNQKLKESGITIAFPQRDIHFDINSPLEIRMHPFARESD